MKTVFTHLSTLFLVLIVSGCTQSPLSDVQTQEEDSAVEDYNDQVIKSNSQLEVITVFENSGNTALQIRNTGTRAISTENISVKHSNTSFSCIDSQSLDAASTADCEIPDSFPEVGSYKDYNLTLNGFEKASYNCSVEETGQVAC